MSMLLTESLIRLSANTSEGDLKDTTIALCIRHQPSRVRVQSSEVVTVGSTIAGSATNNTLTTQFFITTQMVVFPPQRKGYSSKQSLFYSLYHVPMKVKINEKDKRPISQGMTHDLKVRVQIN